MAIVDIKIPDIGDFKSVPVIEVLVKAGDVVKLEQPLVTLESDKATMDVPSPIAGTVAEIVARVGDKVSVGSLVARIQEADVRGAPVTAPSAPPVAAATPASEPRSPAAPPPHATRPVSAGNVESRAVLAGPAVRRLAHELDLDLNQIKGTGEKGRITRED